MKLVIIQIIFIAKYTVSKQNKFIFNLMLVLNIIYHRKAPSKLCNKIWKRNFIYTVRPNSTWNALQRGWFWKCQRFLWCYSDHLSGTYHVKPKSSLVSKFCIDVRSTVHEFHMVMKFCNKEHLWLGEKYMVTYKKNVSLYVGDQLLFFDLVECLRFFPLRLGPTIFTSTNGRNIPVKKKRHNKTS